MNEWFNNDINNIIISFNVSDTGTEIKQQKKQNFRVISEKIAYFSWKSLAETSKPRPS